ncbi:hypothetical protein [Streptomyces beijiangensis]|uniref:Uncharacterized protein n=1 Tax=Streptomyces beijiangensis TaxID=163361 RepID=A0A939JIJ0_9ACTN|nr:hypothetical protein [Streptomyces beijiangensis]MBO0513737.1 hypothetical protein [Streptomyces beijiangensis]
METEAGVLNVAHLDAQQLGYLRLRPAVDGQPHHGPHSRLGSVDHLGKVVMQLVADAETGSGPVCLSA